jgi:RNA polymerase sigma-70 factor, ECF subfamily
MDAKFGQRHGETPASEGALFPGTLSADQVYRDYARRVYHTARRMLQSDLDAEDVTQDVLLQVVRNLHTFRGESAFPTWLHRVTVNAVLLHRRRARRLVKTVPESLDDQSVDAAEADGRRWLPGPLSQLIEREMLALVGLTLPALKSRLHRARLLLRDALAPHFVEHYRTRAGA